MIIDLARIFFVGIWVTIAALSGFADLAFANIHG
jgi:hypothetical protein